VALAATLDASFGEGGFDLSVTVATSAGDVEAVDVPAASFDSDAIEGIVAQLAAGDLDGLVGAVTTAAGELATAGGLVPDLAALLQPLQPAIGALQLAGTDLTGLRARLVGVDAGRTDGGINVLIAAVASGASLAEDPTVRQLAALLGGGLELGAAAAHVTGPLSGIASLVRLVGGLMAVESVVGDIDVGIDVVDSFLAAGSIGVDLDRLLGWADTGAIVDLLVGIDPNDAGVVDLVSRVVLDYAATLRGVADAVVTGMSFGDATLAGLDLAALATRLDEASAAVRQTDNGAIRNMAADVRAKLEILFSFDLPAPPVVDEFMASVDGIVGTLASGIDRFQPSTLTAPVRDALTTITGPLQTIEQTAREVVAAAQAGLAAVRNVVSTVDVAPITGAITTLTAPLVEALDALDALVGAAQSAVQQAADAVGTVIGPVKDGLQEAATAIQAAFGALRDAVDAVGLDNIEPELRAGAETVAGAVAAAQLKPVFDAVVTALDVAASALSLTPRDLLPDDVKQELENACAQLQAVDLDGVKAELTAELEALVASVDTDVLDLLREAQNEVVAFLDSIDPRPPLKEFEDGAFADLVSRLRQADPSTPLAPVISAVDEARQAITEFDPAALLAPLDDAVTEVADVVRGFDPAALLEPVEQQLSEARQMIVDTLQLDRWDALLDDATVATDRILERFEPVAMVAALDAAHGTLVADARRPRLGPGPLGTMVMALLEGTGLQIRPDALAEIGQWLSGAVQPGAVIVERLAASAAQVEELAAAVGALDLTGVVGRLDAHHARLQAALHAHAETSLLRVRLDVELASTAPGPLLGAVLINRDRYLTGLTEAAAALTRLAATSRSELDEAAQALRDAATPLLDVSARLRALVASTTGVTVDGRPMKDVLIELLERFRPALLLAPLTQSLEAARDRTRDALVGAVITPIRDALGSVRAVVETLDIAFVRTEITAARDDVVTTIEALRPSALLGPVLTDVEGLRARVLAFDPLAPVRAIVDGLVITIDTFEQQFAPTVLTAAALQTYDTVREVVAAIAIDEVLRPVLDALDGVAAQLEDGMGRVIDALKNAQDACASGGPSLGAALGAAADLVGAAGSISVSGSFGL
jgi:hypothetical protein